MWNYNNFSLLFFFCFCFLLNFDLSMQYFKFSKEFLELIITFSIGGCCCCCWRIIDWNVKGSPTCLPDRLKWMHYAYENFLTKKKCAKKFINFGQPCNLIVNFPRKKDRKKHCFVLFCFCFCCCFRWPAFDFASIDEKMKN